MTFIVSCYYDVEEELYPNNALDPNEDISYSMDIQPIFQSNCNVCHSATGGQLPHLDNYVSVSTYINTTGDRLLCKIEGFNCGDRMPPGGELSTLDIAKIDQWIEQGYPNN